MLIDLKQALRSLLRAPLFTATVSLTLALGIGLDAAMLAVFDRLLLRPLPFEDLDTLVGVYEADEKLGWNRNIVSAPNFVDFQRQATQFEAMAAQGSTIVSLSDEADAVRVRASRVSHTFFPILRVRPALGRTFTPEEDHRDGPKVVILSDEFWKTQCGEDPEILGRTIRLEGVPHEVVGVLPPAFHMGQGFEGRVYLPMAFTAAELADRARHSYQAIGRLKPGVTAAAADQELKRIAQGLAKQYPDTNADGSAAVAPLLDAVRRGRTPQAVLFIALATLLLLIACANVSNLILARGSARQHDLAIRAALGAGRGALVRRMAAESAWVALIGGALSLYVAQGLVVLMQHWYRGVPQVAQVQLEARTLVIGFAVTAAAVIIASLAPIWRLSRAAPATLINEGARGARGRQQRRVQSALLAVQVCLSMVLLTGAGLMLRTLRNLQQVELGFEPEQVLVADVALPPSRYSTDEERLDFARRLRDTLAELPQARGAAVSNSVPLWGSAGNWTYRVDGQPPLENQGVVWVHAVTKEYFDVLGVPLKRGRLLRERDADACLVNEAFARYHWPEEDPLGHRVHLGPADGPTCTVAGVVGDAHHINLSQPPPVQIYTSLLDETFQGNRYIYAYVQTPGAPALLTRPLKEAVRTLNPDLAADPVRPLEQVLTRALQRARVAGSLFTGFAVLGLVLAAVGLYGLVAYTVAQRTREMGIRQALGADSGRLVGMVLGQTLGLVGLGLAFGLLVSLALGPTLAAFLYGVTPTDLPTLAVVVLLIGVVNLVAALGPAIRAASVPPAVALREE